jgi:hypothetical protein
MSIEVSIKKSVYASWLNHFTDLSAYNKGNFYKVLGPNIIGIELIKLPFSEDYRPHFAIYPLWEKNEKDCLRGPVLLKGIETKRGRQLDIPYSDNEKWKLEAFECVEKQTLPLDKDVKIDELFALINEQLNFVSGPAEEAAKYELKLFSAVYVSNWQLTDEILNTLYEIGKNWNPAGFDYYYGPFDRWYKSLEEKVRNRNLFMNQISQNLESTKLSKLKRSQLLP